MIINDTTNTDSPRQLRLEATKAMSNHFMNRQDSMLASITKVDILLTTITTETAHDVVKECIGITRLLLLKIREDHRKFIEYLRDISPDFQQIVHLSFSTINGELYVSDDGRLETTDPNYPDEFPNSHSKPLVTDSKTFRPIYLQRACQPIPVYRSKFCNNKFEYKKGLESTSPSSLVLDKSDNASTTCDTDSSPDMRNRIVINTNRSEKSIDKITSRKDLEFCVAKWQDRIRVLNPTKVDLVSQFDEYPKCVYFWKNPELAFLLKCQFRLDEVGNPVIMQTIREVKQYYQKKVDLMHIAANDVGVSFYKAGVPNYERCQRSNN